MKLRASHVIEYLALRKLELLVNLLPRPAALLLGRLAGTLLYRAGVYRSVVRANMVAARLGDEAAMARVTRSLYRTMGMYVADFLRDQRKLPVCGTPDLALVRGLLNGKKGVMAVLGHFGNWEMLAAVFGGALPLSVVAMPMHNPLVERWLERKRQRCGVEIIKRRHALQKIFGTLRGNGVVAALVDQYIGSESAPVPFLGVMTRTVQGVAGLIERTGCAVVYTYALLDEDRGYRVYVSEGAPVGGDGIEERMKARQRQHNDILSGWIRQHPEHWFGWFHKRFKDVVTYR